MEQPQLRSRVVELFLDLCAIPSPPGEERAVADRVTRELDAMGLEWAEDDCGPTIGSTAGNVLCRLPGRTDQGTPIFLCAHFDTVPLAGGLDPFVGREPHRARGTFASAPDRRRIVKVARVDDAGLPLAALGAAHRSPVGPHHYHLWCDRRIPLDGVVRNAARVR